MGRSLAGRQGLWLGDKSRMRRESHVRFREGLGVKFPRATRLVICCRGTADEAMTAMREMMSKLRLTVNETKTRLCRVPEETFDFLGYTIGQCWSPKTGKSYIGTSPSAKKIDRLKREISDQTSRRWLWTDVEDRVARLNRILRGWSNYFCLGPVQRLVPSRGPPRAAPTPSVAPGEAQAEESRDVTVPRSVPARRAGPGSLERPSQGLSVGESMSSCPRAGCRKTARPVR